MLRPQIFLKCASIDDPSRKVLESNVYISRGLFAMVNASENSSGDVSNELDPVQVNDLIGKRVLVGITHRTTEGEDESQEQFHGVVKSASRAEGIVLTLANGEDRAIPPDLARLTPASPGEYRLRTTGEVIVDPDFTVVWYRYPKGYKG